MRVSASRRFQEENFLGRRSCDFGSIGHFQELSSRIGGCFAMAVFEEQFALTLARRARLLSQNFFRRNLKSPVFVVGFNNSGKSTATSLLRRINELCIYPGEGNSDLWFRGHFPWIESSAPVSPIWVAPDEFVRSVKDACGNCFKSSRAQMGAYQWLVGGRNLLNDSGMLAGLAPDIAKDFPDAKFIHFTRDGRLAAYITARLEWSRIIRSPGKYIEYQCPLSFNEVLRKMAEYWVWTMGRMDKVSSAMPGSVLEVRYEDWWSDPLPMLTSVSDFIGVSAPKHFSGNAPQTDLTQHLFSEMSFEEISMLERIVGPTMLAKGYRTSGVELLSSIQTSAIK